MIVVVKVGSSSLTDDDGRLKPPVFDKIAAELVAAIDAGHRPVLVSSGAIAAGLPALGMSAGDRPRDARTLQAVAAVGQSLLMAGYRAAFEATGREVVVGQVLLTAEDLHRRTTYLQARDTLGRLLELGVVPVVNENDTVTDEEIRLGDNDRISALVAQLVGADLLVLLTDAAGLLTADPRRDARRR
ncbi:MAG: glutamate 5-kinase [Microthrixaceae bacterium]